MLQTPGQFEPPGLGDVPAFPPVPADTSALGLLNSYAVVFIVAFAVTLLVTPVVRAIALRANVTDHPDLDRKSHARPTAYLGGVAVFLGLIAALAVSYVGLDGAPASYRSVPVSVVLGMVAITFTGLADDVWGWHPRLKIAGQLVAAAALALQPEIGDKVAQGALRPVATWLDPLLGTTGLTFVLPVPVLGGLEIDLIYWTGVALIATFVVGGCNAANLIDGLDGLLSGVVAIVAVGLLAVSVLMALRPLPEGMETETLNGARIVLCLALLGAVLGFLPHNFNPATIFLGDCGSHLLGFLCVVIILMFGQLGQTHLILAGLIVFSVPIIDTTLAIIRRRLAGRPMHAADDQHIHHQLRRSLGGVKRAVFAMYGITAAFAVLGVALAALVMLTELRVRVIYAVVLVLAGFIGVMAVKSAQRQRPAEAAGRAKPAGAASGGQVKTPERRQPAAQGRA